MHYCKYLLIFFIVLFSTRLFAQEQDITGLWKGTIYNDSTKQDYRYEIGISEEKGKMDGFSHTWYNDEDKGYYVVKKVKVKRKDGKIIIEDVDIIAYNYPEAPPKGVRRLHVLTLETKDSILILSGSFSTNRTKLYSPATGMVTLQRKSDYRQSALVPHLQELGLEKKLSFVAKDELAQEEENKILNARPIAVNKITDGKKEKALPEIKSKGIKKPGNIVKALPGEIAKAGAITKPAITSAKDPEPKIIKPAAEVSSRKNVLQETMFFKSDSLQLSLYDNGEVDGDTVSVLMNGKIIMPKQGLSTTAIRKTIFISPDEDSVELVMYAESLGSIPPNTGLLIVRDGKDSYEIRFSGDLQKNAAILFKRKK